VSLVTSLKGEFIILVRIAVLFRILYSNYIQILNLEEIIRRERQISYVTRTFTNLLLLFPSRVRFPMVSLELFIDIILPAALWP
jgi:hypothetical protein